MQYKIGIDARELEKTAYGVARYVKNIIISLISDTDDMTLYLYFKDRIPHDERISNDRVKRILIKVPPIINRDILWQQIYLPRYLKRDRIDIFFSGGYTIPYNISISSICTIHDLAFFVNPRWFPRREGFLLRAISKISLKKASKVIASSNNTAEDIKKYLRLDPDRIVSIYPGLSESFFTRPIDKDISNLKRYNIGKSYILWIASILNRRKIKMLLSAFEGIGEKYSEVDLVIIGEERCSPSINLLKLIKDHPFWSRIHYFKYVDKDDLISFYDNAAIFVFLSKYEGFGYTPLEAASRGIPLVLFDNPTFREIFAYNALFVGNMEELIKTISEILGRAHSSHRLVSEDFRATIEEKYSAFKNNKKVISLIRELLLT
ncbi:glycosyltransferase family 4 protein [bacterium]|nr:glycosyltransferase family 4 protein [bacterium]